MSPQPAEDRCEGCGQLMPPSSRAFVDGQNVTIDGVVVKLTPKEALVMEVLLLVAPRTASKGFIMDYVYDQSLEEPDIKIVDVFVCKIRPKIADTALRIDTNWGKGYRAVFS